MGLAWRLLLLTLLSGAAHAQSPEVISLPPLVREGTLKVRYQIQCPLETSPLLHTVLVRIKGEPEWFRVPVFRNLTSFDLPVIHSRDAQVLELDPQMRNGCIFLPQGSELVFGSNREGHASPEIQARIHAPMLVPRWDQIRSLWNDLPVRLFYSVIDSERPGVRIIRYTALFTDEDSLETSSALERQFALYGRRLDIEWVYEVQLDANSGRVLRRYFQGDIAAGVGHSRRPFQGQFFKESQHPILYIIARHNVFSDHPDFPYGWKSRLRFFLSLHGEISSGDARESVLLAEPWIIQASDEEIISRLRDIPRSTSYFFVRVQGNPKSLPLRPYLVWNRGRRALGATLRKLGLDLFGKESWIAFPLSAAEFADLQEGSWSLEWRNRRDQRVTGPKTVQGYRLRTGPLGLYRWKSLLPSSQPMLGVPPKASEVQEVSSHDHIARQN